MLSIVAATADLLILFIFVLQNHDCAKIKKLFFQWWHLGLWCEITAFLSGSESHFWIKWISYWRWSHRVHPPLSMGGFIWRNCACLPLVVSAFPGEGDAALKPWDSWSCAETQPWRVSRRWNFALTQGTRTGNHKEVRRSRSQRERS